MFNWCNPGKWKEKNTTDDFTDGEDEENWEYKEIKEDEEDSRLKSCSPCLVLSSFSQVKDPEVQGENDRALGLPAD